jgi:hypothetical protein
VITEEHERGEADRQNCRQRLHQLFTAALNGMSTQSESVDAWAEGVRARLVSIGREIVAQGWEDWARKNAEGEPIIAGLIDLMLRGDKAGIDAVVRELRDSPHELKRLGDWLRSLQQDWSVVFDHGWLWWKLTGDLPLTQPQPTHPAATQQQEEQATMSQGILDELRKHRADLLALEARRALWSRFETWGEAFRRFVRRNFPEEVADLERVMQPPNWISVPVWSDAQGEAPESRQAGQQAAEANDYRVQEAKKRLLSFVGDLIRLAEQPSPGPEKGITTIPVPVGTGSAPDVLPQFPFRPYKRFESGICSLSEYHNTLISGALTGQAEWQELERVGGTLAVLASIRRHLPDFDPTEANEPFGPAWLKLMPVLQRCGIQPIDESTTLTVIKAFLDSAELPQESQPKLAGAPANEKLLAEAALVAISRDAGGKTSAPPDRRSSSTMAGLQIFVSWSQQRSREVAEAFREWLPKALPGVSPWISSEDITKGRPWFTAISEQLRQSKVCLICVTPENVKSPWLFYEAGGVAHAMQDALTCSYLIGVEPSALSGTPLAQFQATRFDKEDTRRLIRDFNRQLEHPHNEELLQTAFDRNWTSLQRKLTRVLTSMNKLDDSKDSVMHSRSNSPPSGGGAERPMLSEMEHNVLVEVGKQEQARQQVTAHCVASVLNITEEQSKYYLDELSRKHRLLDWFGNMDPSIPGRYTLTHEGRRLLVEREVI